MCVEGWCVWRDGVCVNTYRGNHFTLTKKTFRLHVQLKLDLRKWSSSGEFCNLIEPLA